MLFNVWAKQIASFRLLENFQLYHLNHFCCEICAYPIAFNEQGFVLSDGKLACMRCFRKLAPKCHSQFNYLFTRVLSNFRFEETNFEQSNTELEIEVSICFPNYQHYHFLDALALSPEEFRSKTSKKFCSVDLVPSSGGIVVSLAKLFELSL